MTEPIVYLHGEFVPASQAKLNVYDAGIVLGATVTEMFRTFRREPYQCQPHFERLARALKYVRFETGLTSADFERIVRKVSQHHAALLHPEDELGIIIFVTAGEFSVYAGGAGGGTRLTPTVCVHSFPIPFELWSAKFEQGQHFVTPSIRHVPPQCYDPKMKYRSRMHYYLGDQEARLVAPDASALLLDLEGNVTETGGANFLIVEDNAIVSPTLRNILPGISRSLIRALAGKLGIPFLERDIQVFNVINAQEAFTCSTPYCLLPVTRINGIPIGTGRPGPLFQKLLAAWSEEVGVDIAEQFRAGAARRTGIERPAN